MFDGSANQITAFALVYWWNSTNVFLHLVFQQILDILLEDSYLFDQRDINERIPLHTAAENGSLECVGSLLRCKTLLTFANDRDKQGMSPLHLAASNKHV